MKAILEYNIEGEDQWDEEKKLKLAINSQEMSFAIWDINQMFRNKLKYNEDLTKEQYEAINSLQTEFNEIITGRNLDFIYDQ